MKKVLKFIKNHKLLFVLSILLIAVIIFSIYLYLIFTDNDETAIYGTRLVGEEKVEIDVNKSNKLVEEKVKDIVNNVTVRKQGRIVNVILTVKDEITRDVAKNYSNELLTAFTDDERGYYDFQIFVNKTNEDAQFPIIGYKHHQKDAIRWTKDR